MEISNKKTCPLCRGEVPISATWCKHCGRSLPPMNRTKPGTQGYYRIVPDGPMFGVFVNGKILVHGLEFKNAQTIISILNNVN